MSVDLSQLHNVLRDQTRARILDLLAKSGPLAYVELQTLLGISHTGKLNYHLKLLGDLIDKDEQSGKYGLTEKGSLALTLMGKFQTVAAQAERSRRRQTWINRAAIAVAGVAIVLSVFFAVVGVPYTQGSIGETCSIGSGCTQTPGTITNGFVPTVWALVPLAAGGTVMLGIFGRVKIVSWGGTIVLAVFSFASLFSIGLLYIPLVPLLAGLLAAMPPAAKSHLKL
jgi:hypothetical protein